MPRVAAETTGGAIDRSGIGLLAAGHFVIDASVGAVSVMLPVFTAAYALSDLAASMILAVVLLASSAIQPLFGVLADRRASPAFLWAGVLAAAGGLALSGLAGSYAGILACLTVSGLGVAAFHPEAARVANRMSADRPATGLAWFMVGGNAGFAVGPLIAALAIPWLGARATLTFVVPGLAVGALLHHRRRRLAIVVATRSHATQRPDRASLSSITLLLAATVMRTWTQFCLLALVPLMLVDDRGLSERNAGFAIVAFSGAGAVGTIAGAAVANRVGGRRMLVWSMPVVTPLLILFLVSGGWISMLPLAAAGFVLMASFSVTVAMGQELLPGRIALAAGVMIGFGAAGSAPPGLALFGAIADSAGRDSALWAIACLPLVGAALAALMPERRAAA